jgi:nitrate/nitrite transport system ATP-binding protein
METIQKYRLDLKAADEIIDPIINQPLCIQVKNVTVSFPTPKGIYTAINEINLEVIKGVII